MTNSVGTDKTPDRLIVYLGLPVRLLSVNTVNYNQLSRNSNSRPIIHDYYTCFMLLWYRKVNAAYVDMRALNCMSNHPG